MSSRIPTLILLTCFVYISIYTNSTYAREAIEYLRQQESAICLINQECIAFENTGKDNKERCLQLESKKAFENNFFVIGDSCSTKKETSEELRSALSAIFASIKKSFTKIDHDFSLSGSVDIFLLYVQTNKSTVVNNVPDEKKIGDPSEQQQITTEPVVLLRLKSNIFFDFNSKNINASGSTIIRQLVSDFFAASPRYKKISVFGHTDNVGATKDNLRLSKARSDIVVAELQNQLRRLGDAANAFQLESVGVGESQPIEQAEREMESQANRRLEIFISPSSIALHKTEKYIQCLHRWDDAAPESDLADCFLEYMVIQE